MSEEVQSVSTETSAPVETNAQPESAVEQQEWQYGDDEFTSSLKAKYSKDQPEEEAKEEVTPEVNPEAEEVTDAPPVDSKMLKFKIGEQEFEVPESYELDVKIDGQKSAVSLAELKKNYSGKVAYDKKFQELSSERTKFYDNVAKVDGKLNNIFKDLTNGNQERGLRNLFKMAKKEDAYEDTMEKLRNHYEELSKLSPEQLELKKERESLEAQRAELEAERAAKEIQAQESEVSTYAESLIEKHSITTDEFVAAQKAITAGFPKEKLEAMTAKQLVDEAVGLISVARDDKLMQDTIRKVDESKLVDKDFYTDILQIMKVSKLDFNEANIEFIAKGLLGKSDARKDSNSKAAVPSAKPGAPSENNTAKSDSEGHEYSSYVNDLLYS